MKIQEAAYSTCGECGANREMIRDIVYGCDQCRKPIRTDLNERNNHRHLDMAVFYAGEATKHLQFCSWGCVKLYLPKLNSDQFATLPYLVFDETQKGIRAQDFFKAFRIKRRGR